MIFIEFPKQLYSKSNIVRYRDIDSDDWQSITMDIETLNLLVQNFGVISTNRNPDTYIAGTYRSCDNPTTSTQIKIKYYGVDIELYCGNKIRFHLSHIEQNY